MSSRKTLSFYQIPYMSRDVKASHPRRPDDILKQLGEQGPGRTISLKIDDKQWPVTFLGLTADRKVVVYVEEEPQRIMFCDPLMVV
jgi:hypothetical protein